MELCLFHLKLNCLLFVLCGFGLFLLPHLTKAQIAELTPKQEIARKIAYIAHHTGVDIDTAIAVAECESKISQVRSYKKNTNGTYDFGVFQINAIHIPLARKMGFDIINNVEDNIHFAFYLMLKSGVYSNWKGSSKCWIPKLRPDIS